MNWQSDFVTPLHLNAQVNKSHHVSNSPNSNSASMTNNTNHLIANNSNYNRILVSTSGSPGNTGNNNINNSSNSGAPHVISYNSTNNTFYQTQPTNYSALPQLINTVTYPSYLSMPLIPTLNLASNELDSVPSTPNVNNSSNSYDFNSQSRVYSSSSISSSSASSSPSSAATKNLVSQIVDLIKHLSIKLVAFDFDCTIVTIHTGGQWIDSPEKLAEFVRPCFRSLLPALLQFLELSAARAAY